MISDYIKMMRPKHYLKNLLIFLPLVFSGQFFASSKLLSVVLSFVIFSMVASSVYIINDLKDKNLDRLHVGKKHRPISSGAISSKQAIITCIVLLLTAGILQYLINPSLLLYGLLFTYVLINIAYSYGLKNIPILDVSILAAGFLIRIFYGGAAIGVVVSEWLYLSVLAFSYYMSLGKRRNEIRMNGSSTRKVNKFYNQEFLDKNMYMSLSLTIIFYSLWAVDPRQSHQLMIWTVPLIIIISMTYSLSIEKNDSDGDPINVLLEHKALLVMVVIYGLLILSLMYLF